MLNVRIERLIGTARHEFLECLVGGLDLPSLTTALRD